MRIKSIRIFIRKIKRQLVQEVWTPSKQSIIKLGGFGSLKATNKNWFITNWYQSRLYRAFAWRGQRPRWPIQLLRLSGSSKRFKRCNRCLLQCLPALINLLVILHAQIKLSVIKVVVLPKAHTIKVRWKDPTTKPNTDQRVQGVLSVQRHQRLILHVLMIMKGCKKIKKFQPLDLYAVKSLMSIGNVS